MENSEVQRAIERRHVEVSKALREITDAVDELEKRITINEDNDDDLTREEQQQSDMLDAM